MGWWWLVGLAWSAPFPDCVPGNPDACPGGTSGWDLSSIVPEGSRTTVRPEELALGSGIQAERAYQVSSGRFDVTVAVLDGGILWRDDRLRKKILLNAGELPLPQRADGTEIVDRDLDGDGVFTVDDYAEDPRVRMDMGQADAHGILDPSDLIAAFSDGTDDDNNGFIDDIAGWNFVDGNNDPYARVAGIYEDHGGGVMREAAAAWGGVCPNCSILPVRIGDAFIGHGDGVGLGMAYAVDRGASVISLSLAAMTLPNWAREVVAHAHDQGVVLVGVAADENAWHANFPAAVDGVIMVHSVRADNQRENDGALSYFNFQNCNNFGPRLTLVAASSACGTGSTARSAGAAALLQSAALELGDRLTQPELRALLVGTATDVALSLADSQRVRTYPSRPGHDAFYGFGRISVGSAVQSMALDGVPPTSVLGEPRWFDWVDPDAGPVSITGTVAAPRSAVASWSLRLGFGAEPDDWQVVASGTGPVTGELVSLDPSGWGDQTFADLSDETIVDRMDRAHEPMIHLQLVVRDVDGLEAVDHKGFWVHRDADLLPGFPVKLPDSVETSPQLADLTGDGVYEVVVAGAGGQVWALDSTGQPLPGFPVQTGVIPNVAAGWGQSPTFTSGAVSLPREGTMGTPAVGDIDGDGSPDIVITTLEGGVYAWSATGALLDGFPVRLQGRQPSELNRFTAWEDGFFGAPALADIDGDGGLDIIAGGGDQRLYVWNGRGELRDGYPVTLCAPGVCGVAGARLFSSPALGDVDADGDLDVVIGSNEVLSSAGGVVYAVDLRTGQQLPGSPISRMGLPSLALLPLIAEGHSTSVAIGDLDGQPGLELFSHAMLGNGPPTTLMGEPLYEQRWDRDAYGARSNVTTAAWFAAISNPTLADLNGDGVPDPIMAGVSVDWLASLPSSRTTEYHQVVGAWDGRTGRSLAGFPRQIDDVSFFMAPAVADITGDGRPEVIIGSGGHFVYAWDASGDIAPGWPKFTGGWMIGAASVGDIDGDGWLDVVQATRQGHVFAWRTAGRADRQVGWSGLRHDNYNTGNAQLPLRVQAGPDGLAGGSGGCCSGSGSGAAAMLLLPGLLLRRRRTGR